MHLPSDILNKNYRKPDVILCQTNKEKICKLNVVNLEAVLKFNSYSEISFDVPSVYSDPLTGEQKPTPYYDFVEGLRLVYLEGFGYFQLQDPEVVGDGIQEYKSINAYSLEYTLSQRYLDTFVINKGTTESIDDVVLYDESDSTHSLLNLATEKIYGWTIGHVDTELKTQKRGFEIDRQSIYDFLMNDLCDTFKCYIVFDTNNNTINVYSEEEIERYYGDGNKKTFALINGITDTSTVAINGHETTQFQYDPNTNEITFSFAPADGDIIEITDEFKSKYDTDVIISFENLSNEMKVDYSADDIKTMLTVKGADDLDIRAINFGLPNIINLEYYHTVDWMGQLLYDEYSNYLDKQEKYLGGFYSIDNSGAIEELFNIIGTQEDFIAGNSEELQVTSLVEPFDVDSYSETFNVNSFTEEFITQGYMETFREPELDTEQFNGIDPQIEPIAVTENVVSFEVTLSDDSSSEEGSPPTINNVFVLPEDFIFNQNSIVKLNDNILSSRRYAYSSKDHSITLNITLSEGDTVEVLTCDNKYLIETILSDMTEVWVNSTVLSTNDYEYNSYTKILTINSTLRPGDVIKIYAYENAFQITNTITDKSIVYVNNKKISNYVYEDDTKTLIINMKLDSSDVIKIATPQGDIINSFKLEYPENAIVSVFINENETDYTLSADGKFLIIPSYKLTYGDIITVNSVKNSFALTELKDKVLFVKIGNYTTSKYTINDNILVITDNRLIDGSKVTIQSIDTHFIMSQRKDEVFSVKISGNITSNYTFNYNTNTLIISDDNLNADSVVEITTINNYFMLQNTLDKITTIRVDGDIILNDEFIINDNVLTITLSKLSPSSIVEVESIKIQFQVSKFDGDIYEVLIDDYKATEYSFDTNTNILTVNDDRLGAQSIVIVKTVNNKFVIYNVKNKISSVEINGNITDNYLISSDGMVITITYPNLKPDSIVTINSVNNKFELLNDYGDRRIVEKMYANTGQTETLSYGPDGYEYDKIAKILSINVPIQGGDKIVIRSIDSPDALLIVDSNPGSNEILLSDVNPTLNTYTPKTGDYVVKITGYTDLLKELYSLIDEKLDEEHSVPDEYNITVVEIYPGDSETNLFEEASIKTLGNVYKVINKDSNDNDVGCKYYVCEMKFTVEYDDHGNKYNQYYYVWNERDLVFGDDGSNSLKEKIDIYSAILEVQIEAGWSSTLSENYKYYKETIEKLEAAKNNLEQKESDITNIDTKIAILNRQISNISSELNVIRNFSPESLDRLFLFLREDEYSDDCFVVTETDTDTDILNVQKELLVAAQKELNKISKPTLSFSASIKNIYGMPEFSPILHQFDLGNFIKVRMRQGFLKKVRLLEVEFNFEDLSDFSCTFGDLLFAKDQGDIHADLLAQAVSAGKTVASGEAYWQKGYDVATSIDEKIQRGLIDATTEIKSNSAGQNISWDNYGIHLRKITDGELDPHEGWITNNMFLYSDDNFRTTKSVFGEYKLDGKTYWGLLAECVSAGLVEGSHIIGGTIKIGLQSDGTYAFEVLPDGTVKMNRGDAAEKLSYFDFDPESGLIVGENLGKGEYFSRISSTKIEFCRRAKINKVPYKPSVINTAYDYYLYEHTEGDTVYYDYYKMTNLTTYEARASGKNFEDPEIKFGIVITYFTNDTAYMKQADVEGNLQVGTGSGSPYIALGNFKFKIEGNGSLSITVE